MLTTNHLNKGKEVEIFAHLLDTRMLTFNAPPMRLAVFERKMYLGVEVIDLIFSNDGTKVMLQYYEKARHVKNIFFQAVVFSEDWKELNKYKVTVNSPGFIEKPECWVDDNGRPYLLGFTNVINERDLKGTNLEGAKCVYHLFAFFSGNDAPRRLQFELEPGKYVSSLSHGSLVDNELFFMGYYSSSEKEVQAGFCYFTLNNNDFTISRIETAGFTAEFIGNAEEERLMWETISTKKRSAGSQFGLNFPDDSRLLVMGTNVVFAGNSLPGDLIGVFINSDGDFERADLLHYGSDLKMMRGYMMCGYDDEQIYVVYTLPRKEFFKRQDGEKPEFALTWVSVMKSINRDGDSQLYLLSDQSVKDRRFVDMRYSTRLLNGQLLFYYIYNEKYSFGLLDLTSIPKTYKG